METRRVDRPLDQAQFERGLSLFNRTLFFDAHEALEDVWRSYPHDHPARRHFQGLVQLAVAFHHESTDNPIGARSVLERAQLNLNGAESSFPDLDLDRLRKDLAEWQIYLAAAAARPNPPQIVARKNK